MKDKLFAMTLLACAVAMFSGCAGEEDDIFSMSAADRLTYTAGIANQCLTSSPAGWSMEYYPTTDEEAPWGLGYLMLTVFNANGSTKMCMNNDFSSNQYLEDVSAWDVITDNGVVLTYNTFNQCIHAFCDPEDIPFTYDTDELGSGCEGDYEFIMVDVSDKDLSPEYMMLKGKKRGVYVRLARLDEGTDFQSYMEDVQAFNARMFPETAPNYLVLTLGDSIMRVDDIYSGIPNIYPMGGDAVSQESYHPFLTLKHNGEYRLRFRDELNCPDGTVSQEFVYDEATDCFYDVDNPANTLDGANPADFFMTQLEEGGSWMLRRSSEMSDAASEIYESIYTGLGSMRYTLQNLRMSVSDGELLFTFNVRNANNASATATYTFAYAREGDALTLTYLGPDGTASENVLANVPPIQDFINAVSGTGTLSSSSTKFDLSDVKLTCKDSSVWFVFTLN